jgi:peptidylprolyl isomerase
MKKVENGDLVTVNYTGRLVDGTIFDTSMVEGREPLQAKLGQGSLIKGFEEALIGMSVGEKKTVEVDFDNAYGPYNDFMVQEVELDKMPGEVQVGTQLQSQTDMGPVQFVVKEVKEETVVLDANHPLAGENLIFDLEIVGVE